MGIVIGRVYGEKLATGQNAAGSQLDIIQNILHTWCMGDGGLLLTTVIQRESPLSGRHWVLQRFLPLNCVRCHGSSMFAHWSQPLMQIITAIITLVIPAFGARSWFFSIDPAAESPVRLFLFGGGIYISMVGMIRTISMPSETAPSPIVL